MRIVLDMDQVLCDWVGLILRWCNEDRGTSYSKEDVKSWNVVESLGPDTRDFLRSCMRYPFFYQDVLPIEGAVVGTKKLISDGHDVVVCTAVPKCAGIAYMGKQDWLRRNMPFFPLDNLVAASRKELVSGDLLLDDGPHNVDAWLVQGRRAVVFDAPWNRGLCPGAERVSHWNEFLELVDKPVQRLGSAKTRSSSKTPSPRLLNLR